MTCLLPLEFVKQTKNPEIKKPLSACIKKLEGDTSVIFLLTHELHASQDVGRPCPAPVIEGSFHFILP